MAEKILSCFIDEAGDFGEYDHHSPYYIVSVILHEQSDSIQQQIDGLDNYLSNLGYPNHALHTGPLIRREPPYEELFIDEKAYGMKLPNAGGCIRDSQSCALAHLAIFAE